MAGGNGLNTLEYAQKLKDAGVPAKQAEAQALVLYEIINSNLATRRDIEEIRAELKRDIETVRTELKRDIKELELKIKASQNTQTFQIIGAIAALFAIFRFLPDMFQ